MKKTLLSLALVAVTASVSAHKEHDHGPSAAFLLNKTLAAQPDAVKARYDARHPKETLTFFGIKPGMKVVEALPGGGWYSKILLPYLGKDGQLIGADYAVDMYPKFGFFTKERLEAKKTWVADWTKQANGWRGESDASIAAFQFGSLPADMHGKADAVLFVRALHNLARFEKDGGFLTAALKDANMVLKQGGVLGIVQHKAPDTATNEWADGSRGYLKQDWLIKQVEQAGFTFEGASDINANPKDQPGAEDIVWRLPPTLATSREDEALKAEMQAIGESNRMTLRFRKVK